MQLHGTRNHCPVVGEYQITDSDQRFVHLHSPVRALQIPPFSERQAFALHIRVSRFSGLLGPRNGTVAPLRRRCAGLGEAILARLWQTQNRGDSSGLLPSTILHQDPRYFPSRKRMFTSRVWYSATRVVVTKNDSGDSTFNSSEFLGALFTSALQNSYYPRHDRNVGDTMSRFGGALSSDAIGNLLREFTPDMKRLFRRHAPKKIRKIEEKLPIPPEDKP